MAERRTTTKPVIRHHNEHFTGVCSVLFYLEMSHSDPELPPTGATPIESTASLRRRSANLSSSVGSGGPVPASSSSSSLSSTPYNHASPPQSPARPSFLPLSPTAMPNTSLSKSTSAISPPEVSPTLQVRGGPGAMRSSYIAGSRPPFAHAASAGPALFTRSNGASNYSAMSSSSSSPSVHIPPLVSSNSSPGAMSSWANSTTLPNTPHNRIRNQTDPLHSSSTSSPPSSSIVGASAMTSSLDGGSWELVVDETPSRWTSTGKGGTGSIYYNHPSSSRQPTQPYFHQPPYSKADGSGSAIGSGSGSASSRPLSQPNSLLLDPATQIAAELAASSLVPLSSPYTSGSDYSPALPNSYAPAFSTRTSSSSSYASSSYAAGTAMERQVSSPIIPPSSSSSSPSHPQSNKLTKSRNRRSTSLTATYDQALPPIPLPPSKDRDRIPTSGLAIPGRKKSLGSHSPNLTGPGGLVISGPGGAASSGAGTGSGIGISISDGGGADAEGNKTGLKSMLGGFLDLISSQKKVEISTPYDPVHLTHVGFNVDTGEFTGLPKEWQQLLSDSGISKQEQLAHPQAVVDIVAFYQDATKKETVRPGAEDDDVWQKFGSAHSNAGHLQDASLYPAYEGFSQPVGGKFRPFIYIYGRYMLMTLIFALYYSARLPCHRSSARRPPLRSQDSTARPPLGILLETKRHRPIPPYRGPPLCGNLPPSMRACLANSFTAGSLLHSSLLAFRLRLRYL